MFQKIINQMKWRAAIKSYNSDRQLSEDQVNALIETARLAPTSYGIQPIKLYVVSKDEIKKKLYEAGFKQSQFLNSSHIFLLAVRETLTNNDIEEFVERTAQQRNQSLESLTEFRKMLLHSISGKSEKELFNWSAKQAYLVLGMMLAAAAQMQIDTSPMEGFSKSEFDEILNTKEDGYKVIVVMAAGFRSDNDKYSKLPKVRKDLKNFVERL